MESALILSPVTSTMSIPEDGVSESVRSLFLGDDEGLPHDIGSVYGLEFGFERPPGQKRWC